MQLLPGESTLPQSNVSQAGSSQASPVDSSLSPAESELYQAGSSHPSPEDSTLPQSDVSQAGSSQASPVDGTLSPAESEFSQVGTSQSFLEDSALSQSDISQKGSSQSSPKDSTLQAERAVLPQSVRHSARLRASHSSRQAGTTPREDSVVSQPDNTVPQVASPQASASQEAGSFPNKHITPLGSSP